MKKKIIIITAGVCALLVITGWDFKITTPPQPTTTGYPSPYSGTSTMYVEQAVPRWEYKVVSSENTEAKRIAELVNKNSVGGWFLDSTMVIPPERDSTTARCNLIFKKKR